jgi:branched-subunit amino acid transport protein
MGGAFMSMWLAVVLVGLGSYAFRVVPLLLGEHVRLLERADATLRHAAVGAMTALMVLGVRRFASDPFGPDTIALGMALATSGMVALAGRSMPVVVLCGGVSYGLALGALRVLIA